MFTCVLGNGHRWVINTNWTSLLSTQGNSHPEDLDCIDESLEALCMRLKTDPTKLFLARQQRERKLLLQQFRSNETPILPGIFALWAIPQAVNALWLNFKLFAAFILNSELNRISWKNSMSNSMSCHATNSYLTTAILVDGEIGSVHSSELVLGGNSKTSFENHVTCIGACLTLWSDSNFFHNLIDFQKVEGGYKSCFGVNRLKGHSIPPQHLEALQNLKKRFQKQKDLKANNVTNFELRLVLLFIYLRSITRESREKQLQEYKEFQKLTLGTSHGNDVIRDPFLELQIHFQDTIPVIPYFLEDRMFKFDQKNNRLKMPKRI